MTQEVLKASLEAAEKNEFTKTHFTAFLLRNEYQFSPSPDVAIQEEEDEDELEEIEEYDEWDDDDEWEDDEWDDEEWGDEEVDWDEEDWEEED